MEAAAALNLACTGCGRKFAIAPEHLARRRTCAICGAALAMTAEAEGAVKAFTVSESTKKAAQERRSAECPLCTRTLWYDGLSKEVRCTYCACPSMLDESGTPQVVCEVRIAPLAESYTSNLACPACGTRTVRENDAWGMTGTCTQCKEPVDLHAFDLGLLVQPLWASTDTLVDRLSWDALCSRWRMGDMSIAEALELIDLATRLKEWDPGTSHSPFSPMVSAEIIQFLVLEMWSAVIIEQPGEAIVSIPVGESLSSKGPTFISENMLGMGLLTATGHGFIATPRSKEEEKLVGQMYMQLKLIGTDHVSDVDVLVQSPIDGTSRMPTSKAHTLLEGIFVPLGQAAERFIALKVLYGHWLKGSMVQGLTSKALEKRMQALGGLVHEHAPHWSSALASGT